MSTTDISIKVTRKIATTLDAPVIVCGNNDYRIYFKFDQEWETSNAKTARFVFRQSGKIERIEVAFTGTVVGVPILSGIDEVYVGVYAGELHTTTPARIICKRSILCLDAEEHEAPAPDVYQQILATMNNLDTLPTVTAYEAGKALMVNENGRWAVRLPNFIYDQNSGELLTFFIGTVAEWEAWTGDKDKCIFFPLDLNVLDEVEEAFANMQKDIDDLKQAVETLQTGGVFGQYQHNITVECYGYTIRTYANNSGVYNDYIKFTFTRIYYNDDPTPNTAYFTQLGEEYKGDISYALSGAGTFTGRIKRVQDTVLGNTLEGFEVEGASNVNVDGWWIAGAEDGGEVVRVTDNVVTRT